MTIQKIASLPDTLLLETRELLKNHSSSHPSVMSTFEMMVESWSLEYKKRDGQYAFDKLLQGMGFAATKHKTQQRNHTEVPYIVHPLRVANLLWNEGDVRSEEILLAALLHDTLEDTSTSDEEIIVHFGMGVLNLVKELTEEPGLSGEQEALHAKIMSKDAKIIKLADRAHNLRDLLDHPPKVWRLDKVGKFIERSRFLLQALEGTHTKLEQVFVLALEDVSKKKI